MRPLPIVLPGTRPSWSPVHDFVEQNDLLSCVVGRGLCIEVKVTAIDARKASLVDGRATTTLDPNVHGAPALRLDELRELWSHATRNMSSGLAASEARARDLVLQRHLDERVEREPSCSRCCLGLRLEIGGKAESDRDDRPHHRFVTVQVAICNLTISTI